MKTNQKYVKYGLRKKHCVKYPTFNHYTVFKRAVVCPDACTSITFSVQAAIDKKWSTFHSVAKQSDWLRNNTNMYRAGPAFAIYRFCLKPHHVSLIQQETSTLNIQKKNQFQCFNEHKPRKTTFEIYFEQIIGFFGEFLFYINSYFNPDLCFPFTTQICSNLALTQK